MNPARFTADPLATVHDPGRTKCQRKPPFPDARKVVIFLAPLAVAPGTLSAALPSSLVQGPLDGISIPDLFRFQGRAP